MSGAIDLDVWLQPLRSQLGLQSSNLRFCPFGPLLFLFGPLLFLFGSLPFLLCPLLFLFGSLPFLLR
jgi:hypothetical protein